jgi:hypothetical protein
MAYTRLHWWLLAAAIGTGCGSAPEQPPATSAAATATAWTVNIEPLDMPAAAHTAQPHLTTSSRGVLLSWLEQGETDVTLKFAERSAMGWSAARTVASGSDWFVSSADVPSVLRLSDGTLVAHWYAATDLSAEAYDIRLAHSGDDGKTWSRPMTPHHDRKTTQHGFASLFEQPSGGLGLVWLDGRDGDMAVYFADFDRAWKQEAETRMNARVCECCPTSAVVTTEGVVAAFRDRSPGEIRDIHVSRLERGAWTDARPIHIDNWKIEGCPVDGPALNARGRQVAAAWFTATDDKARALAAFSADGGRTWGQPVRLDDQASLGHVDIELLDDGSAVATWLELAEAGSRFMMRRVEPSGRRSTAIQVATDASRVIGYPRMARSGDELVFAWTEREDDGGPRVKGAIARARF